MKSTSGRYMNLRLTAESVEAIASYINKKANETGHIMTKTEAINRMLTEVDP